MTSLAAERTAQAQWTSRLRRSTSVYDWFLEREFESDDERFARTQQAFARLLRFCATNVPHYRRLFREMGIDAQDTNLAKLFLSLPILRKLDLRDHEAAFHAERLPDDETPGKDAQSSGTTGMPVRVRHTRRSNRMFYLLKQREYRWFRFDPGGMLAVIRYARNLLPRSDGSLIAEGESYRVDSWPYVGVDFSTGPSMAFSTLNSPDDQVAWLRRISPDHLLVMSATLEHQARAAGDERPCESLKSVVAIAEQLTPDMRAFVERSFGVPIHQNYGLNEFGLVAARCEAGRYHVHSEHCVVEIVRDDGQAASPGEKGRVVVTGLTNFAMPLLRYDADDLAIAADGPCSCGRTLPSFGDIVGRYTPLASAPEGTIALLEAVRGGIMKMPPSLIRDLRQFQLHLYRDGRYELRLLAREKLPDRFEEELRRSWVAARSPSPEFSLTYVEAIERGPGGKYQVFTSDFAPSADRR